MLVVRGIKNCEFCGPLGPNGWRPLLYGKQSNSKKKKKALCNTSG
jgi:hypothetical protein